MPLKNALKTYFNSIFARFPDILFITTAFAFFLALADSQLLFPDNSFLEGCLLAIIVATMLFCRKNAGLNILIVTISLSVHSYCANATGTFQPLFQISWLLLVTFLIIRPELSAVAVVYHCGLSFDAAFMRTTGLGMQAGFYCSNLVILLLAAVLQRLWHEGLSCSFDSRHFSTFAAGIIFISLTFFQPFSAYTNELLMLLLSLALFWSTSLSEHRDYYLISLAISGSIIALISIGNLIIISESAAEIMKRRAWAAGTHPNRLATWAFAMQLLIQLYSHQQLDLGRKLLRIFQVFLWTVIILSGARLILAISIMAHLLYFGRSLLADWRSKIAAAAVLVLSFAKILQQFSWSELLKNERLMIWFSAWENICRKPLLGHGFWSMSFLPQSYPSESMLWAYDWNYPHAHQLFLELLLWGGVFLLLVSAGIWIKAFRSDRSLAFRFCMLGFLASGVFDFAWGSPSMFALALFLVFYRFSPSPDKGLVLNGRAKGLVFLLMALAIGGAFSHQFNLRQFEKSTGEFMTADPAWQKRATTAAANLKEPFPKMHLIIRQAAAGYDLQKLIGAASELTLKFPDYYAVWFLLARLIELDQRNEVAAKYYEKAVELEPRDLTGIRHARLLLTKLNGDFLQLDALQPLLVKIVKLGHWGMPLIVNHPDLGQGARSKIENAGNEMIRTRREAGIDRLFLFKNSTEWGINLDFQLAQSLRDEKLPGWLNDELAAALLKRRFSTQHKLVRNDLEPLLQQNSGPALCRAIAGLAVAANLPDIALKAYQQHRLAFNFRGKNYEDLEMQFYAAQAFLAQKQYIEAKNELDRIAAFDHANPAVFQLLAEIQEAVGNREEAVRLYGMARQFALNASFLPNYHFGVYDENWPEGDHWTLVIEKTLRRRDNSSRNYCQAAWLKQVRHLDEKLKTLRK